MSAGRQVHIACLGECMLELVAGTGDVRLGFGGDTLNTAAYLARELGGAARVHYVTALGDDPMSDELVAAWRTMQIDTRHVQRRAGELPGLYLIRNDAGGERSFYYWREQAAVRGLLDAGHDAQLAAELSDSDVLYLSGITLAIFEGARRERLHALLAALRASGVRIAFDTNFRPRLWPDAATARRAYVRVGAHVDIAMPGLDDERAVFGIEDVDAIFARWHEAGASETVLRQAAAGAEARAGDERAVERPPRLAPVDTTAAGDAFNAAYLAARLRGASLSQALRAANELAGHVIMHAGAIVPVAASHPRAAG